MFPPQCPKDSMRFCVFAVHFNGIRHYQGSSADPFTAKRISDTVFAERNTDQTNIVGTFVWDKEEASAGT